MMYVFGFLPVEILLGVFNGMFLDHEINAYLAILRVIHFCKQLNDAKASVRTGAHDRRRELSNLKGAWDFACSAVP